MFANRSAPRPTRGHEEDVGELSGITFDGSDAESDDFGDDFEPPTSTPPTSPEPASSEPNGEEAPESRPSESEAFLEKVFVVGDVVVVDEETVVEASSNYIFAEDILIAPEPDPADSDHPPRRKKPGGGLFSRLMRSRKR